MTKKPALGAATLALGALLFLGWWLVPTETEAREDWWLDDYQTALLTAAKTSKPILLVFR